MLLNGDMISTRREIVADLRSEVMRLEREVKVGEDHLVSLQNSMLQTEKEIVRTEELLATATDEQEKYKQLKKLNYLKFKLECSRGRPLYINEESPYYGKIVDKVK